MNNQTSESLQRDKSELVEFTNLLLKKIKELDPAWAKSAWIERPENCRALMQAMFPDYQIKTPPFEKAGK